MEHICIVAEGYPTDDNPIFSFVDQLVCNIADQGWKCSVIAPQSVTKCLFRGVKKRPYKWGRVTKNGNTIDIYQPVYVSLSNNKRIKKLAQKSMQKATERAFEKINRETPVTICYSHFWHCAMLIGDMAKRHKLPLFVACGESNIGVHKRFLKEEINSKLENLMGVISVSTENKLESVKIGLCKEDDVVVLPNGVDSAVFYQTDKIKCRQKLGIDADAFVVGFLGSFIERKGPLRLCEAIKLSEKEIKSVFIGAGEQNPDCDGIIYKGRLPHGEICEYLNACDVFVLPTLSEGCCNAIIEAMACGLPVISSDKMFNDDILDESCSIRIDSADVNAIKNAIEILYNDREKCKLFAKGALKRASELQIEMRAKKIMDFISERKRRME